MLETPLPEPAVYDPMLVNVYPGPTLHVGIVVVVEEVVVVCIEVVLACPEPEDIINEVESTASKSVAFTPLNAV